MKKRGFTLIELLAVIVILAIIALIITPIVTGIIKKTKESADLRSAEAYVKAGENYYAKASTSGGTLDANVIDSLELSSTPAEDGSDFVVGSDGTTDMAIIINNKCYRKTYLDSIGDIKITDVVSDEDRANCTVPIKSNYAFLKQGAFCLMTYRNQVVLLTTATSAPSTYAYSEDLSDKTIEGNPSIMAYYVGTDSSNSLYNVYLVSSKPIAAPVDGSMLFQAMFNYTGELNLNWLTTYFTTDMTNMFHYDDFSKLTLGSNFYTHAVTNMMYMFYDTGFAELDLGTHFDTSNVTNMMYMFQNSNLTSLDLGDYFDTSKVTNMNYMFYGTGASTMTSLDLGPDFKNIASINTNMFGLNSTSVQVKVSSEIYSDATHFKLNKNSSDTIEYKNGTVVSTY